MSFPKCSCTCRLEQPLYLYRRCNVSFTVRPSVPPIHVRLLSRSGIINTIGITESEFSTRCGSYDHRTFARKRQGHAARSSGHHRAQGRSRLLCHSSTSRHRAGGDDRGQESSWQSFASARWHLFGSAKERRNWNYRAASDRNAHGWVSSTGRSQGFLLTCVVVSTMTIDGDIELASPVKLSSAVSRSPVYELTSKAILPAIMLSEWHRNCCFSGESLQGDVGGRASSLRKSKVLKGSSKSGSGGCGHWRW